MSHSWKIFHWLLGLNGFPQEVSFVHILPCPCPTTCDMQEHFYIHCLPQTIKQLLKITQYTWNNMVRYNPSLYCTLWSTETHSFPWTLEVFVDGLCNWMVGWYLVRWNFLIFCVLRSYQLITLYRCLGVPFPDFVVRINCKFNDGSSFACQMRAFKAALNWLTESEVANCLSLLISGSSRIFVS